MKEEQIREILRDSGADIVTALKIVKDICSGQSKCTPSCPFKTTRPGRFCELFALPGSLDIERIKNDINNYI